MLVLVASVVLLTTTLRFLTGDKTFER